MRWFLEILSHRMPMGTGGRGGGIETLDCETGLQIWIPKLHSMAGFRG
jgi:hypothetical protein